MEDHWLTKPKRKRNLLEILGEKLVWKEELVKSAGHRKSFNHVIDLSTWPSALELNFERLLRYGSINKLLESMKVVLEFTKRKIWSHVALPRISDPAGKLRLWPRKVASRFRPFPDAFAILLSISRENSSIRYRSISMCGSQPRNFGLNFAPKGSCSHLLFYSI